MVLKEFLGFSLPVIGSTFRFERTVVQKDSLTDSFLPTFTTEPRDFPNYNCHFTFPDLCVYAYNRPLLYVTL